MNMNAIGLTTLIGLCFALVALCFLKGKGTSFFRANRGVVVPRFKPETLCRLTGICFLIIAVAIIVMGFVLDACPNWCMYIFMGIIMGSAILISILFKLNKYFS
ncbi:MAG: hypothetical protein E7290_00205 [Lachnospiraceae bacterium]|nr:hypothetical protein [Lachnospiraceae bacterium]